MLHRLPGLLFFIFLCRYVQAGDPPSTQAVQWASAVLGVSSEERGEEFSQQYRASQILGKPNRLPQPGDNPCAWSPLYAEGVYPEWITVRCGQPIPLRQIVIFESGNPGAITRVSVLTPDGREVTVYENNRRQESATTPLRILIPESRTTGAPERAALVANTIKITLLPNLVPGKNQIDAVGISSETEPVDVSIRLAANAPKELIKENLGPTINSAGQEVAPVISPDGKTLFFTRGYHPQNIGEPMRQDVWFSRLGPDNVWGRAVNIGPPINNGSDNAICSISPDGQTIYLINIYQPNGSMIFGLSRSTRTRDGWSRPVECVIRDNYGLPQDDNILTEYAIAPDERTLIISVRRREGLGGKDLFVSFLQPDNTWSAPKLMGNVVNTADFEGAPFIAADNKTLYFTSAGHPNYGQGDIFLSRRLDDTWLNWSEPENLGPAINTPKWDGFFTIPASGEYAYLSTLDKSVGEEDIFRVKLFPEIRPEPVAIIAGQVLDALTRQPIATDVVARPGRLSGGLDSMSRITTYDPGKGDFRLLLPIQQRYVLEAKKEGYFPTSELLDLSAEKRPRELRKTLLLTPIRSGQKFVLREVLFVQSKADLLEGSEVELNRVVEIMKTHPNMEILVEGHTDNQGDFTLNIKLSEERVRVVRGYLTEQGIAAERIQTKAWGPSRPIASNETEEKRRLNRRVEFTILKM